MTGGGPPGGQTLLVRRRRRRPVGAGVRSGWGPLGVLVLAGVHLRSVSPDGVNGTDDFVLAVQPECAGGDRDAPFSCHFSGGQVAWHGRGKATRHL